MTTSVDALIERAKTLRAALCIESECIHDQGCGCLEAICAMLASEVTVDEIEAAARIIDPYAFNPPIPIFGTDVHLRRDLRQLEAIYRARMVFDIFRGRDAITPKDHTA